MFEQLFGAGGTPEQRSDPRRTDTSILDWVMEEMTGLRRELGPADRQRLDQYVSNIREIEQRIQRIEERNNSGERAGAAHRAGGCARTPSTSTSS